MSELTNANFNRLADEITIQPLVQKDVLSLKDKDVTEIIDKLKVYWPLTRIVLRSSKLLVPQKIDKGIDEFISIVDRLTSDPSPQEKGELLEKFAVVWGIIHPILTKAKDITGPKADAVIDQVLIIGKLLSAS